MTDNVSIIIVNWNSGEHLRLCLESIFEHATEAFKQVLVIDNVSTDGSERAAKDHESVELIQATSNLGFAKACNLGAQQSKSEFILFLNPDAKLFSDTLNASLKYMNNPENQQVGICGVQLIDEQGKVAKHCSRYPTFSSMLSHSLGLSRLFQKLGYDMSDWSHNETREVDHVIGAYYLVRRELFEKLNGFDERFFVYLEDLDFSFRASKAGWKTVYLAEAQAFHLGGGCSSQVRARRLFYSLRSRLLYSFKHFSRWQGGVVVVVTCIAEPCFRALQCIFMRDFVGLREVFRGYWYLYKQIPKDFQTHWYRSVEKNG
jgi:hypothetical protein